MVVNTWPRHYIFVRSSRYNYVKSSVAGPKQVWDPNFAVSADAPAHHGDMPAHFSDVTWGHGVSNHRPLGCFSTACSADITENANWCSALLGPLLGESTSDRWIPLTEGQLYGKRPHVVTLWWADIVRERHSWTRFLQNILDVQWYPEACSCDIVRNARQTLERAFGDLKVTLEGQRGLNKIIYFMYLNKRKVARFHGISSAMLKNVVRSTKLYSKSLISDEALKISMSSENVQMKLP